MSNRHKDVKGATEKAQNHQRATLKAQNQQTATEHAQCQTQQRRPSKAKKGTKIVQRRLLAPNPRETEIFEPIILPSLSQASATLQPK